MNYSMMIEKCKLIEIPKISDDRGTLSFVESNKSMPFKIRRFFYIYDINIEKDRGEHAHKECEQFIICLRGSFDVIVDDGLNKKTFNLKEPTQGLYLPAMIWTALKNFSENSICFVAASEFYNEDEYIREYSKFISESNSN